MQFAVLIASSEPNTQSQNHKFTALDSTVFAALFLNLEQPVTELTLEKKSNFQWLKFFKMYGTSMEIVDFHTG